jgi:hypothetical protein
MKDTIRYFIWNGIIFGTLAAGYYAGNTKVSGVIIGILYALIIPLLILSAAIMSTDDRETIERFNLATLADKARVSWRHILEPVLPFVAYKMGYTGIAVAMVCELFIILLVLYSAHNMRKRIAEIVASEEMIV